MPRSLPPAVRPRRRLAALATAFALAGAALAPTAALRPAAAQGPDRARCNGATFTPAGEGSDTVYLAVGRAHEAPELPAGYAGSVLDAVAEEFRMPPAIVGAAFSAAADRSGEPIVPPVFRPALTAAFLVEFKRDGRVARARAAQRSLVDAADAALYRAVMAADSAHSFFARDGGPGTLPMIVRLTLHPDSAESRRPVAVLRQPRYRGQADARLLSDVPEPVSPEARQGLFSGSQVTFEYVVDLNGRPLAGTERLASYTNPALAGELYRWVRDQARFAPAQVDGCPVRQLVTMRFAYRGSGAWFVRR